MIPAWDRCFATRELILEQVERFRGAATLSTLQQDLQSGNRCGIVEAMAMSSNMCAYLHFRKLTDFTWNTTAVWAAGYFAVHEYHAQLTGP